MAIIFEGGRIAITDRTWQAAEEVAVVDWVKTAIVIFALGIDSSTHNGDTVTPELRWRNVTDAGSWTVLGATGEVKQATTSALTDDGNLATGNMGTSPGDTQVTGNGCEQENSGIASSSTTLAKNEGTELQCGISFADGDDGDEYEFGLFESGSQIDSASLATVTLAAGATPQAVAATAIGVAVVKRKTSKTIAATAVGSAKVNVKQFVTVAVAAIGTAVVATQIRFTQAVVAVALANPTVSKLIRKMVPATAVGVAVINRKMFVTVAATALALPVVSTVYKTFQTVIATAIGVAGVATNYIPFVAGGAGGRFIKWMGGFLGR